MLTVLSDAVLGLSLREDGSGSAYDKESMAIIKLNNTTVLYLKEVTKFLALVCILREESFERKGKKVRIELWSLDWTILKRQSSVLSFALYRVNRLQLSLFPEGHPWSFRSGSFHPAHSWAPGGWVALQQGQCCAERYASQHCVDWCIFFLSFFSFFFFKWRCKKRAHRSKGGSGSL